MMYQSQLYVMLLLLMCCCSHVYQPSHITANHVQSSAERYSSGDKHIVL